MHAMIQSQSQTIRKGPMFAAQDYLSGLRDLRASAYLAAKQIQTEHRRNLLGTAWVLIGFAITAGGIAWLIAQLQGRPISLHIPYVVFGFAAWNFISSSVTEGCHALTRNRGLMLQAPMPRSIFVFSLVLKKLYLLALHLMAAGVIAAALGWRPSLEMFLILPALAIFTTTAIGIVSTLAVVCAVYRDISEVVNSVMRLSFFFTPIIWTIDTRFGERVDIQSLKTVVTYNPFAYFLEILRAPMLGETPDALAWIITGLIGLAMLTLGFLFVEWLGRRLVYWL
ncbi:hypothetical protein DDZ18_03635 [Marinicauda salina]|uniref:ABC-2 type transporter transmembrane domain-containing protein n=1 Tax=Marinicauda salina TaxID=2135793 RepID=A0A2U2BXF5_9PROT|nr:ABC transporter permease [Marinicauda salina]PWE18695.1 hypothetical protein DDZ18_03635 [Marinicauda salina]